MNKHSALVVVITLASSGCSSLYGDYAVKQLTIDANSEYQRVVKELTTAPASGGSAMLTNTCLQAPVASASREGCKIERNAVIAALVLNSERMCVDHRKTIYGNDATWNITSGSFTNLFAGAAAVANGTSPKTLFSALALFSNSERSLVNETIYKSVIVPAADEKIVQTRETKAREFFQSYDKEVDKYHVTQAISDVVTFHYTCSFMDGLRLALKEGTQNTAQQKLIRLRENLRSLTLDMSVLPAAGGSPAQSAQAAALKTRYDALSAEITTLEKQ